MHVVGDVELVAILLIGKAHLDDANPFDDCWIGKNCRGYVRGSPDHKHGQPIVFREATRSLNQKGDGWAWAGRLRILHWQTPAFNQWRMRAHSQTVLDHVDEDAVRRMASRRSDRRGMCRHHAK